MTQVVHDFEEALALLNAASRGAIDSPPDPQLAAILARSEVQGEVIVNYLMADPGRDRDRRS